jgi:hypothetical protein
MSNYDIKKDLKIDFNGIVNTMMLPIKIVNENDDSINQLQKLLA